jgi:hypothetical protein
MRLQHIVDTGAMGAVAAFRIFFGVVLLCSPCSGQITSSSAIFLLVKPFVRNFFARNSPFPTRNFRLPERHLYDHPIKM